MRFLHCVLAEFAFVTPRFTRTRLGLLLLALGATLLWLGSRGVDPVTVTLLAGSLGAIVAAGGVAGNESERGALSTALGHPTTPLAIATGRWIALVSPGVLLAMVSAAALGWQPGVAIAGSLAVATVGSCALAVVIPLGNPAAMGLFLFMALAGAVAPERIVALAEPGFVRLAAASVLELGPALWHYRSIRGGDWGALIHALAWTGLGILLASAFIGRQRTQPMTHHR